MHGSFRKMIKETIHESQKCQRNWNLNEQISEDDKKLIIEAATNSPSKQNMNFFKLHVIEDREIIEKIHENTRGFGPIYKNFDANKSPKKLSKEGISHYEEGNGEGDWYTNSQVLGQMLLENGWLYIHLYVYNHQPYQIQLITTLKILAKVDSQLL